MHPRHEAPAGSANDEPCPVRRRLPDDPRDATPRAHMKKLKVVLGLITQDNDYQREQALEAERTARRLGIDLQVFYAGNDAINQSRQLLGVIQVAVEARPDAVVVEPVGTGMGHVAKAAADRGIGWMVLNREADYLKPIRSASDAPVGSLDCDNEEVGRIQGRQFGALLPDGGAVLYIEGPVTDAARQRRVGMEETLPRNIEIKPLRGKWTEESAFQAVTAGLSPARHLNVGVIGCQNDAMARGARRAIEAQRSSKERETWLSLPFTGCDGVPATGQAWLRQGLLAATVIIPPLTGIALDMLAKAIQAGTQVPERTLTKPTSRPSIEELRAKYARRIP